MNESLYLLHQRWCDQAIKIEEVATLQTTPFDVPCTIWTAANHYVQALKSMRESTSGSSALRLPWWLKYKPHSPLAH